PFTESSTGSPGPRAPKSLQGRGRDAVDTLSSPSAHSARARQPVVFPEINSNEVAVLHVARGSLTTSKLRGHRPSPPPSFLGREPRAHHARRVLRRTRGRRDRGRGHHARSVVARGRARRAEDAPELGTGLAA